MRTAATAAAAPTFGAPIVPSPRVRAADPLAAVAPAKPRKVSKARQPHTYRATRRNVARKLNAAGLGGRLRGAFAITAQPWAAPIVEFLHAQPTATREQVVGAYMEATEQFRPKAKAKAAPKAKAAADPVAKADEPAEAPKPKRARKPAVPKDVTAEAAPKAPRKRTAAPKAADAPAKPKAAPRRRAPAAA